MFNKDKYGKILVPMVTPFKEDQSVDYEAAASIARKLVDDKLADSIVLSGTTGEFFTMSFDERVKLFRTIKAAVGNEIPLIAGTGCASTIETIALSKKAEELGYELVMVVSPYYTKPNQEQLYNHYKKVAESIKVDMLVYNIPIFTGVNVNPETLAELAKIKNIVGVKEEAELNAKQITAFLNATPEDFIIYNGDDTMVIEAYAQGGAGRIGGVISGASHIMGHQIRAMIDAFLAGKVQEVADTQRKLMKFYRIMGQNGRTNPVSLIKDAMRLVGYNAGYPRLPLTPGTPQEIAKIKEVMKELQVL
ncbi:4-hydroxy-tetrahydrodipicolinate synthase [Hydrogenispora ethanolica]|uniref:4-hydroxy-tetrahydrodipicolinate synthase n=1 Tax=Hydrogenispora ethanolica TaxID=1082276 RepID=A0A4R1RBY3_HYDET|nr:4-hydroxy-tetrahydrodipicolinate synthase [Hydrogenispora ethanolica]TCL63324.1 4-hydroxy-tetrahydrodipicolinate synthase [Hydrogenispora ethanolica]